MIKKKTTPKTSPDRLAKTGTSPAPLSDAQLEQVTAGLNFTKIEYKNSPA